MNKFKIYKILDSTSSATYWSFINEEKEDDEFIECIETKGIEREELTELFNREDDLGQSVLFESLLEFVSTSEQQAVNKFKEKFKSKLLLTINENNLRTGYSDLVDQDVKTKNGLLKEIIRVLESEEK